MPERTMKRRELLTRSICAGSFFCLGGSMILAALHQEETGKTHKFLEMSGMTYEEVFQFALGRIYVPTMRVLTKKVGLDVLEKAACEAAFKRTEAAASRFPKRDLSAFTAVFKNPNPHAEHMLTMEVVEDTDAAFEMKFTECLWAKTFREANAADIGYRCICRADYATAEAFNPKLKLVRDKTLMQGHSYCNHRCVMEV